MTPNVPLHHPEWLVTTFSIWPYCDISPQRLIDPERECFRQICDASMATPAQLVWPGLYRYSCQEPPQTVDAPQIQLGEPPQTVHDRLGRLGEPPQTHHDRLGRLSEPLQTVVVGVFWLTEPRANGRRPFLAAQNHGLRSARPQAPARRSAKSRTCLKYSHCSPGLLQEPGHHALDGGSANVTVIDHLHGVGPERRGREKRLLQNPSRLFNPLFPGMICLSQRLNLGLDACPVPIRHCRNVVDIGEILIALLSSASA